MYSKNMQEGATLARQASSAVIELKVLVSLSPVREVKTLCLTQSLLPLVQGSWENPIFLVQPKSEGGWPR